MTTSLSDFRHRSRSHAAPHRFARLGTMAQPRRRALVPQGPDAGMLTGHSDHLLRDLGFAREPAARMHAGILYL
jgi:hypothetical protein